MHLSGILKDGRKAQESKFLWFQYGLQIKSEWHVKQETTPSIQLQCLSMNSEMRTSN